MFKKTTVLGNSLTSELTGRLAENFALVPNVGIQNQIAGIMSCLLATRNEPHFAERIEINLELLPTNLRKTGHRYPSLVTHSARIAAYTLPLLDDAQAHEVDDFLGNYENQSASKIVYD